MNQKVFGALLASAFAVPLALPLAAQAQMQVAPQSASQGAYLGANVGKAEQRLSVDGYGSRKDDDTGYKLYGGYGINQNFGVEAGYVDFGKVGTGSAPGATASSEPRAVYLAATGTLPLNPQVSLFAKAGVAANRSKIRTSFAGVSDSNTENRVAPMFGVGAAYNFTPNVAMVAEYENFGKIAKEDGADLKANMMSVGVRYKFH